MPTSARLIRVDELPALLELYAHLNPDDTPLDPNAADTLQTWRTISGNPALRYFVAECDGKMVATCNLSIIPNLTRNLRPYGLIENVVTHPDFRQRGFGKAVLRAALEEAWAANCYKVMLLSGSKREETLRFYEGAGFQRGVKTGFVAYRPSAGRPRF